MPVESIKGRGATRNPTPTRFNLKDRMVEFADAHFDLLSRFAGRVGTGVAAVVDAGDQIADFMENRAVIDLLVDEVETRGPGPAGVRDEDTDRVAPRRPLPADPNGIPTGEGYIPTRK